MAETEFEIKLPQFEGPFDLLLFFIERDELEINDIPIARITDDFLNYLHQMTALNMDVASEFIFVAATLMRIKAKMLLPRFDAGEAGETNPKEDLILKLIEYKKFKQICEQLRPLEEERMIKHKRGNIAYDLQQVEDVPIPGEELSAVSLYKLMLVYDRVINRYTNKSEPVKHTVIQYPYTIEKQKETITNLLSINKRMGFSAISQLSENKVHFVYNFLALLEMLQQQLIDIQLGTGYNNFWVTSTHN